MLTTESRMLGKRARTVRRGGQRYPCKGITCPTLLFSGQAVMTRGVEAMLSPEEIAFIVADLHAFVQQEKGIDYLQVVRHVNGEEERYLT